MKKYETVRTKLENSVLTIELARNEVRNSFNDQLIADIKDIFDSIEKNNEVRVVALRGEGQVFCAGGDLKWMQKSANLTAEQNYEDARKLSKMFEIANHCPKPVIGFVHGAAIGGGVGLVSICDYVVASKETVFSLSEVRLGIIPACIGPFVIAKIGESHARALFISAERFQAERAFQIGLVHELVEKPEDLNKAFDRITSNLLQCGPNAMAAAKSLIRNLKTKTFDQAQEYVARTLAELRIAPEGQEGLKSFLEKRKPNWIK